MDLRTQLEHDVDEIVARPWNQKSGRGLPSSKHVALAGGAVELNGAFLYADLASSSEMVKELDRQVAAKILRAFHTTTARLVAASEGAVVSFDGDRVLGAFQGEARESSAVRCALHVKYAVQEIIRPRFEAQYEAVRDGSFRISHGVGIDTGTVLVVRAGARDNDDLVWIGRAPSVASRLSYLRESPYATFVTAGVYERLEDWARLGDDGDDMWEPGAWEFLGDPMTLYRSRWLWKP